jgi:hypothetical protein
MTSSDLVQMVGILKYELFKGWQYLSIAKQLQLQYANAGVTDAIIFFGGVMRACVDCAILSFTKVIDAQDKLSIDALLRDIHNNRSIFDTATADKIAADVQRHKQELDNLKPFIKEIRGKWRNEVIAHTSMNFIREEKYMASQPPINMSRLEQSYRDLFDMLGVYGHYLEADTAPLDPLSQEIEDDVKYLVTLLLKAKNASP